MKAIGSAQALEVERGSTVAQRRRRQRAARLQQRQRAAVARRSAQERAKVRGITRESPGEIQRQSAGGKCAAVRGCAARGGAARGSAACGSSLVVRER